MVSMDSVPPQAKRFAAVIEVVVSAPTLCNIDGSHVLQMPVLIAAHTLYP